MCQSPCRDRDYARIQGLDSLKLTSSLLSLKFQPVSNRDPSWACRMVPPSSRPALPCGLLPSGIRPRWEVGSDDSDISVLTAQPHLPAGRSLGQVGSAARSLRGLQRPSERHPLTAEEARGQGPLVTSAQCTMPWRRVCPERAVEPPLQGQVRGQRGAELRADGHPRAPWPASHLPRGTASAG